MRMFSRKRLIKLIFTCGFYAVSTALLSGCWIDTYTRRPVNISFDGSKSPYDNYLLISKAGAVSLASSCYQEIKAIGFTLKSNDNFDFNLEYSRLISNDGSTYEGHLSKGFKNVGYWDITFDKLDCRDLDKYKLLIAPIDIMGYPTIEAPLIQFKSEAVTTDRYIVSPLYIFLGH